MTLPIPLLFSEGKWRIGSEEEGRWRGGPQRREGGGSCSGSVMYERSKKINETIYFLKITKKNNDYIHYKYRSCTPFSGDCELLDMGAGNRTWSSAIAVNCS